MKYKLPIFAKDGRLHFDGRCDCPEINLISYSGRDYIAKAEPGEILVARARCYGYDDTLSVNVAIGRGVAYCERIRHRGNDRLAVRRSLGLGDEDSTNRALLDIAAIASGVDRELLGSATGE